MAPALPAQDAPAGKTTLATASWLAGSWSSGENGRRVLEQWMSPAGGTMVGMSRTVARGKTVGYESLLSCEESDSTIN